MGTAVVVFIVMIVVLAGGFFLFQTPSRRMRNGKTEHDTVNPDAESPQTAVAAKNTPENPVSEPPVDTLAPDGSGTAVAGSGAGGYTPDARRPLTTSGGDTENSPDQS